MVEIQVRYEGELHCVATHVPSQSELLTDAPVDNQGRGAHFSPTDLMATALGTCMLTTMGIVARRHGEDLTGLRVVVAKHMTQALPRRIDTLAVTFRTPAAVGARLSLESKRRLEEAAHGCPVRISLLPAITVPVSFDWSAH